ncbi:MAG TPA: helix-turn-helix domain-containing protein, partial [Gaiellaceae bacterium]
MRALEASVRHRYGAGRRGCAGLVMRRRPIRQAAGCLKASGSHQEDDVRITTAFNRRRLRCPACGIDLEAVAWARPGAGHTRDFEDTGAWLAQQMAKTQITRLLRIGWSTVGQIVTRVVADQLDERRLSGLVAIGCDEISYRRGQRYL